MSRLAPVKLDTIASITTFGDLLRYLRQCNQMTQRDLALSVGYSISQISRLEHNERLPDELFAQFAAACRRQNGIREAEFMRNALGKRADVLRIKARQRRRFQGRLDRRARGRQTRPGQPLPLGRQIPLGILPEEPLKGRVFGGGRSLRREGRILPLEGPHERIVKHDVGVQNLPGDRVGPRRAGGEGPAGDDPPEERSRPGEYCTITAG